jgi:hypothetical protein
MTFVMDYISDEEINSLIKENIQALNNLQLSHISWVSEISTGRVLLQLQSHQQIWFSKWKKWIEEVFKLCEKLEEQGKSKQIDTICRIISNAKNTRTVFINDNGNIVSNEEMPSAPPHRWERKSMKRGADSQKKQLAIPNDSKRRIMESAVVSDSPDNHATLMVQTIPNYGPEVPDSQKESQINTQIGSSMWEPGHAAKLSSQQNFQLQKQCASAQPNLLGAKRRSNTKKNDKQENAPTNPFKINPNAIENLTHFFSATSNVNCCLVSTSYDMFRKQNEGESIISYITDKKQCLNWASLSPIKKLIDCFLPNIIKHSRYVKEILDFDPDHKKAIVGLREWHHVTNWKGTGMHTFYPYLFAEATKYGYDNENLSAMECSVFETHRRILRLEQIIEKMTRYLHLVISKSATLHLISMKTQQAIRNILEAGSGMFGKGKDFWTQVSSIQALLKIPKFNNPNDSETDTVLQETINWLCQNRKVAFTRYYPVGTDLQWGLPTLALCFHHRGLLENLAQESSAKAALKELTTDVNNRIKVYVEDLRPLVRYGGEITKYARYVLKTCEATQQAGIAVEIPLPKDFHICSLTPQGLIIGPDGRGTRLGHMEVSGIIPFPESCCLINPLPTA